jgi:molybdopterin-containing oxidoreductase family membrane subunit
METVKAIAPAEQLKTKWFPVAMAIGIPLVAALVYSLSQVFIRGHEVLASTNDVPWNLYIVIYAYGISSIGLSYIASFGTVLGIKRFDVIARRALFLAIILIAVAMLSIFSDMGRPDHAYNFLLYLNPTSALGMVAISINLYAILIALEFYILIKKGHDGLLFKGIAIAGFLTAIVVHSFHGAIFGLTQQRHFWDGPYYPLYFLLSALFASSAIIVLVTVVTYKVTGRQMSAKLEDTLRMIGNMLLAYLVAIGVFFLSWKMYSAYYFGKTEAKLLLFGPYWFSFWFLELGLGYIIPFLILLFNRRRSLNVTAFASVLVLIGLFFSRYNFIIVGQLVPGYSHMADAFGGTLPEVPQLVTYSPNGIEILTAVGLLGLALTAYALGVKYLPLDKDEE